MSFAQRLKVLRAEHNMTQKDLSEHINVARATIAGYETRDRQPSYETLTAIAQTFDVSIAYLLDCSDDSSDMELVPFSERLLDQRVFDLYGRLTVRSKRDAYQYLHLLELRDKSEDD